ncbi:MAG: phage integrase SAM-like domain-containing protein [Bacteroides sp.]|nr:phage integrase SAM-like domain-containing protein [Bacteroides sp.]
MATYRHFEIFTHGSCSVEDINLELCNNFKNYLLAAHQIGRTKHSLSQNSAASYFSIFSSLLKIAFFEKLLDEDPNLILEKIYKRDTLK